MISRAAMVRAVVMVAATVAVPILWVADEVGGGLHHAQINSWQIRVAPSDVGLFISEWIELDFGTEGHGRLERSISNGLGAPTEVRGLPWYLGDDGNGDLTLLYSAFRLEARGTSTVAHLGGEDEVVHGSPTNVMLLYDVPADPEGLSFDYEIIGGGRSLDANEVTVNVVGLQLSETSCRRASGKRCEVTKVANHFEIHLTAFDADDSLTIAGTVDKVFATADDVVDLEFVESRHPVSDATRWWAGLPVSFLAFVSGRGIARGVWRTRRDARRRALAGESLEAGAPAELPTIEPWMATTLWHERSDLRSVRTWLAQQVADDVLRVEGENNSRFARGDRLALADLGMAEEFERLVGPDGVAPVAPSARVSRMLRRVARRQRAALPVTRWWSRFGPGAGHWFSRQLLGVVLAWAAAIALLIAIGWSHAWSVTVLLLVGVPASVAAAASWWLAPVPTSEADETAGALLPLRTFLDGVTTSDVEQLWRDGRLTEFCVWAVAMGAADHWYETVRVSGVPAAERLALTAPLALGRTSGSWILTAA